ncbi:spore coat U domain-containing protein [Phyllobacterium sp. LjRoot231]
MLRLLCFLSVCLLPAVAHAQTCSFSANSMTFAGSTLAGAVLSSSTTVSASCTGLLSLGTRVLICPDINEGSGGATAAARQMVSGTNKLNYQLYSDAAHQLVWGSATWGYAARPPAFYVPLSGLPGALFGSATSTITMYGTVLTNQTAAAPGTYSSSFGGSAAQFRYRWDDGLGCNISNGTQTPPNSFTVSMVVAKDCTVSAQDIDFGTRGVLSSNVDVNGQVSVACSSTTPYTVALSQGGANAGPVARRMTKGAEFITYGLYTNTARSLPWGDVTPTNTVGNTGTGLAQNLPVYARIPPQTTPGVYSDTIIVTVTY